MQKILLVDDSELYLEVARNILKDKYEIITAKSGKEALGYLAKGVIPNLILLDILMPEMDGWDVFKLIKGISLLRDVPIAFLSALDDEAVKDHASGLGATDFITKPFKEEILIGRIDSIIEKHQSKNY